jgi:peptidoglycan-associated lipoprotein
LLKDAANSARNVAALDLSSKDANARAVGTGGLSNTAASDAANAAAAAAAKLAAAAKADASAASASSAALAMRERVVYFDFDSFVIRPEARPIIEAHGRRLRADAKLHVALEGHTDDRGGREYNLGLGQKRADAVRKALSLMGVTDGQMEAVSFGKEKPAVPGNTEAAMQENRRVEINYR